MRSVLHLIPTLEGGGAERQLSMLAAEQSQRGMRVHVGMRRGGVHKELLSRKGVSLHCLGDYGWFHPLIFIRTNALIKKVKPDIVQTWLPQMDVVGGVACLWNAITWIISERTSAASYAGLKPRMWFRYHLGKYARAIVANSAGGVEYWRKPPSRITKVFQIDNAIDVEVIRNTIDRNEESHGSLPEILVVGRLVPLKAVDVVIRALSLVSSDLLFRVSIIGDGPMRGQLESEIRRAGMGNRITLSSYDPDWWRRLNSTSLLISMSRFEGQPNVVLESIAMGCPLILSDIPAHRELLDDSTSVLIPLDNHRALAQAISDHFEDPSLARARADLAKGRTELMTIQSATDAYNAVYSYLHQSASNR